MIRLRNERTLACEQCSVPKSQFSVVCHNSRSLHKHIEHYRNDTRINSANVLVLQETWASKTDPKDFYHLEGFQAPFCIYTDNRQHRPHSGTFVYVKIGTDIVSSQVVAEHDIELASLIIAQWPPLSCDIRVLPSTRKYCQDL